MVLARCLRSVARLTRQSWDKTQVELQGFFSYDHAKHFEEYVARTSTAKAWLICLWTPVPVVALAVMIEAIPTEDPATHTARQSPFVWLRVFAMSLLCSVCYLEQFRQHLPTLRLPWTRLWVVSIISTAVSVGFQFSIADQIAYPFPFSVVVASFVWAPALSSMFLFAIRTQLREEPQLVSDLRRHLAVCVCQFVLVGVYPLFNAGFSTVSEWKQTALVFVLPFIKLGAKNWISRWIANAEDARAEAVIFNVDVFHAL